MLPTKKIPLIPGMVSLMDMSDAVDEPHVTSKFLEFENISCRLQGNDLFLKNLENLSLQVDFFAKTQLPLVTKPTVCIAFGT